MKLAGFTLLEMLLAIAMMAMFTSFAMMTLPGRTDRNSEKSARQFYQKMLLVHEQATLMGKDYGVHIDVDQKSYSFLALEWQGWRVLTDHRYFHRSTLSNTQHFTLTLGESLWQMKDGVATDFFDDEEEEQPFEIKPTLIESDEGKDRFTEDSEEGKTKAQPRPDIFIFSSGEITPFELAFSQDDVADSASFWRVKASESGELQLLPPGSIDEE